MWDGGVLPARELPLKQIVGDEWQSLSRLEGAAAILRRRSWVDYFRHPLPNWRLEMEPD